MGGRGDLMVEHKCKVEGKNRVKHKGVGDLERATLWLRPSMSVKAMPSMSV